LLALTPKGETAVYDAVKAITERQKILFEPLSLKDETAFERAIDALAKALG
jgi:hypothetical protein